MGVKQYDSFIGSPEFPRLELMNGMQNIYIEYIVSAAETH